MQNKMSLDEAILSRASILDGVSESDIKEGIIILPSKQPKKEYDDTVWLVRDYERLVQDLKSEGAVALINHLNHDLELTEKIKRYNRDFFPILYKADPCPNQVCRIEIDLDDDIFSALLNQHTRENYPIILKHKLMMLRLSEEDLRINPYLSEGSIRPFSIAFRKRALESIKLPEDQRIILGSHFKYHLMPQYEGCYDTGWWTDIIHGLTIK
jgi:hypothetical protein